MLFSVASKLLPFVVLATSFFALPVLAQDANLPVNHVVVFNLYQKHVSVSGDEVIDTFLRDIMAMGVADVQTMYPDKIIGTINGPTGPPTNRVDMTIALTDLYITAAREKKRSHGRRSHEDWVGGFATFSVRRKGHGVPEAESSHPSTVKTHPVVHAQFMDIFYRIAGSIPTSLVCVPCDKVWGVPCSAGGPQPCTPQAVPVPI